MDNRHVRVLKTIDKYKRPGENIIFVDEKTRIAVNKPFGEEVVVVGRNRVKAIMEQIDDCDSGACVVRLSESLFEAVYVEVGEDLIIYKDY